RLALAFGTAEHALAHRQGVAVEAPVVDGAEGEYAGDVVAGFLVADRLDPQVRIVRGTLRQPARGGRGAGVVGGDGLVGGAVLVFHLAQVGAAQGDVGGGVVQAVRAVVAQAGAAGDARGRGRQQLHQSPCVGGGARLGVEDALG